MYTSIYTLFYCIQVFVLKTYDYCIIGAGIDGLTFADTILTHSDRTIAIIDPVANSNRPRRGDTSLMSRALSDDRIGLASYTLKDWRSEFHRARIGRQPTPFELQAYREYILDARLTRSGRLERLSDVDYLGNDRFRSRSSLDAAPPNIRRSIVKSTPSSPPYQPACGRSFTAASTVHVVKPSILRAHAEMKHRAFDRYCVIGAGPVGIDVMLALIELDIPNEKINWVKPREGWMLSQPPAPISPATSATLQKEALTAMAHARNAADLGQRLEHLGLLTRATDAQAPTHFLPHMISHKDARKLRQINGVIRKGHVHAISEIGMVLSHGAVPMPRRTLYLDCTWHGKRGRDAPDVFTPGRIDLSQIRLSHPSFSAALIGAIELSDLTGSQKNALCTPIRGSNLALCFLTSLLNHHAWFYNRDIRRWLETCRLDPALQSAAQRLNASEDIPADLSAMRAVLPRAIVNLESLVEQSGAVDPLRA